MLAVALLASACERASTPPPDGRPYAPSTGRYPLVAAAGDIACSGEPCDGQRRTAALIEVIDPALLLPLGDLQYEEGEVEDFAASYDPTWGRFVGITRPVPGNHEYRTDEAAGYFDYFGPTAGPRPAGYYSYDVGTWHVIAVNSGAGEISQTQLDWIADDLASDEHRCELAYWHHPRFTSGTVHGPDPNPDLLPLWDVLHAAGVDVVLNGHSHQYERFAPLDPLGRTDPTGGIREFVVGTGGRERPHPFGEPLHGSQVRITDTPGILELELRDDAYRWRFVVPEGIEPVRASVLDQGVGRCHE